MKRCLWGCGFLLLVLMLCLGIGTAADAVEVRMAYVQGMDMLTLDQKVVYVDSGFYGDWRVQNEGVRVMKQETEGTYLLRLSVRSTFQEEAITFRYEDKTHLRENNMLVIPLRVDNDGPIGTYDVRVTLELADGICEAEASVQSGRWQSLVVDVSELQRIDGITVSISCDSAVPGTVQLSPLYLTQGDAFQNIERFMTPSYLVTGGKTELLWDGLSVRPTATTFSLEGQLVAREQHQKGTRAFLLVILSGEISTGSIVCSFRGATATDYRDSASIVLRNGQYVYAFPFTVGEVADYRLQFRNTVCGDDGLLLESVSVLWTGDTAGAVVGDGYVSSVSLNRLNDRSGSRLVVSGSISQAMMAEHSKDELVLYAVPYTEARLVGKTDGGDWGGVELVRSKIYMNFELILDSAQTERYVGTHMFYVTIEGGKQGKLLLASPKGVDYERPKEEESSVVGISGASVVGTFESNASHVIVELPMDRLVVEVERGLEKETEPDGDDIVSIVANDGTVIRLNKPLLRELLAEVGFYASANIDVYLRMTNGETSLIEGVMAVDAGSMELCSAVLSYLLTAEDGVMRDALAGVILGEARAYTVRDLAEHSMYFYTRKLAELMRVIYSTVYYRTQRPVSIILPLRMEGECNDMVVRMLAMHTKETGTIPGYIMCEFSSADMGEGEPFAGVIREGALLLETVRAFGVEGGAVGKMYCFTPDASETADEITSYYSNLCELAEEYAPQVIFLNTDRVADETKEALYRQLKTILRDEKNSIIEAIEAELTVSADGESAAEQAWYTVWDFSRLYYTDGWVAGGTVSGCTTERSGIFSAERQESTRALRTAVTADNEYSLASAIVLRNFSMIPNLTEVDDMIFRFSVAETEETATVIFIVGNELKRAEYTLTEVAPGQVHTVRCPISEFTGRGKTAYIGVMVYSADAAVLEIGSVQVTSDTLSAEGLAALFTPAAAPEEERGNGWMMLAVILGVLSVILGAVMIRRDKEEADEQGKAVILKGRAAMLWQRKSETDRGQGE